MALIMKCQIKNIKSSEEFETYKEFIDNKIKLMYDIRYDVRYKIQNPPKLTLNSF